jgi:hypothetical protein
MLRVLFAVRTEFLNIIYMNYILQMLNGAVQLLFILKCTFYHSIARDLMRHLYQQKPSS